MALKNAERIYDPIHDLEKLLTLDYIIKLQQIQYQDIYDKCVISISNSVTENNRTYTLHNGILYIKWDKSCLKLLIPDKLLTKLPLFIVYNYDLKMVDINSLEPIKDNE